MSDETPYIESTLAPADAAARVRKMRGKTFFISANQRVPIAECPDKVGQVSFAVSVTRKQALKFLAEVYSEALTVRGAMVVLREYASGVFIGE
jgi:hypothetical protein